MRASRELIELRVNFVAWLVERVATRERIGESVLCDRALICRNAKGLDSKSSRNPWFTDLQSGFGTP